MTVYATNGAKLFIGGTKSQQSADYVVGDFSSQSWVEIKEVENMGKVGDTSESVDFTAVGDARKRIQKGARSAGTMEVICGIDPADAGQIAAIAAEKTIFDYAFKIQYNDAPPVETSVVTISIASPGVVTWAAHGRAAGDAVKFSTTGALPTGLTAGTTYYVLASGLTSGAFQVAATPGGSAIVTSGTQSGVHTALTVPAPSQRLFIAKVMSQSEQLDAANNVMKLNLSLAVNSNVVRVDASGA